MRLLRRHGVPKLLCFRSVTLMDRMAYNKDGGIFAGFFSADWMRALSYKAANVPSLHVLPRQLRMGVLERSLDRRWVNLPRYLRAIDRRFGDVCSARRRTA